MIDVRESTDKLKILIVDDSELNRELLAGMLEDEYEIYQVENGMKAIDILEKYDKGDCYLTNLTRFLIHRTH